ncbi:MAG: hypothetical protein ACRDYF_16025 [Acidimicrobiia bacterium]
MAGPEPSQGSESSATALPPGSGYWLVGADGNVYPFGVPAFGSLSTTPPARPIAGGTGTPGGNGYWLVGTDGGVFAFGDAGFHGSTGAMRLNSPIVGMAATPSGRGYWLVAADGGIFAFGDARFYGSTGSILLNKPITGMSASGTGRGYRFVASDGGLFSFGDTPYAGSAAGRPLPDPIVGMAGSPTGNGYWLVGSSGAVYGFGDVSGTGSMSGTPLPAPIVAIVAPPRLPEPPPSTPEPSAPSSGDTTPSTRGGAIAPPPIDPFRIALIGDTGYTAAQDQLLLKTRTAISSRAYAFVVHDGDVQGPREPCADERLRYVHEVFDGFSVPLVFTPGDNEWASCPEPAERLAAIRQLFFSTDQSLGQRRIPLTRQAAPFVENARWMADKVVFATLNVPGPTGRSSRAEGLSAANVTWLNEAFDLAEAQDSPGVMIIWQDDPFVGGSDDDLQNTLVERALVFGKPVVLVHGDSHFYRLGNNWPGAPNLIELQTFALDNINRWVEVTVDPADPNVFRFDKMQG